MRQPERSLDYTFPPFFYGLDIRFFNGPKGIGAYTKKVDLDGGAPGYYWSCFLKPKGPGARSGQAQAFEYTLPTVIRHRKQKDAWQRAWRLANGIKKTPKVVKPKPPIRPGSGYCLSCRKTVLISGAHNVLATVRGKPRMAIRGNCPDCHTVIQKFGKLIDCPECERFAETAVDDYICKECRRG